MRKQNQRQWGGAGISTRAATSSRWRVGLALFVLPLFACTQGASESGADLEQSQAPLRTAAAGESTTVAAVANASATPAVDAAAVKKVVWVTMKDKAMLVQAAANKDWKARGASVRSALVNTAAQSQASLRSFLGGKGVKHRPFWIVNALKVEADQATIDQIKQRSDVASVVADHPYQIPPNQPGLTTPRPQQIEWGVASIRAPEVWSDFGAKGDGVVVANIDTGVEYKHPALLRQYRGSAGDGSFDHNYNWFDPTGLCGATPCDNAGHGTHTMGTMVGDDGDPGDNQIGVAPHATWIAAKGCETNSCSTEALLAAAEWILAPTDLNGQNPRPDLRPHIVNNSWGGMGGDTFYQAAVEAWVQAGIFPAFSNGNSGPSCGSAGSPGDYPESYASGAYDEMGAIAFFSSRGPSPFGVVKPNIGAPGVNVRSSVPGGGYDWYSGTSMASPHLAGAVALMWSAAPALLGDVAATRVLLDQTAVDTEDLSCGGDAGNNDVWGEGRLDALAAVAASPIGPSGTLQGQVLDSAARPIPGASVLVQGGSHDRTVRVAPDGTYQTRLPAGNYTLTAKAFGFVAGTATVTIAQDVVTTQSFVLEPAPSFALSGSVLTAAGVPMPGAQVTLVGTPVPPVTADGNGHYAFEQVPAGSYEVRAQGSPCWDAQVLPVAISASTTLDFALPQRVDGFGYSCLPASYSYIEANTPLVVDPSTYLADVTLPFPFTLYGQTYETAKVAVTGYVTFGGAQPYAIYWNVPIPDPTEPNAAIYAFWDDLMLTPESSIRTEVVGTAPNRQFVIEWRNVVSWENYLPLSFELVLSEKGGILMQYPSGADPWQQGLMATLGLEDGAGKTAFQYSYNQAVAAPQSAVLYSLPPSGVIEGTVSDANDGSPAAGATIEARQGSTVVRSTTTTASGFYRLFVPAGSYTLVATKKNYATAQATLAVALDQTVQQSFALETGIATVSPGTLQLLLPAGRTRTRTLSLTNSGSTALSFSFAESGGRKATVTPTRTLVRAQGFAPNAFNTKGLFSGAPRTTTTVGVDEAGDVIKSFVPAGMEWPWGVGVSANLWLSDAPARTNTEFTSDGAATGRQWPAPWSGEWPADMAYDDGRGLMCQLAVGGDNGIHCWDTEAGVEVDKITGSFPWTQISQRGLAYRADDDSFYVGGWNDGVVYHIKGLGASDKGTVISTCQPADGAISGLAYNAAAGVLWVATNSWDDTIYELNPDDCTVLAKLAHPTPGYAGAGLELDAEGNLWMVNQTSHEAFLMDSGVPAFADVPWLTPTPTTGTVAPGTTAQISVTVDTNGLDAGMYLATLYVQTTAAKQPLVRVPVSLVVTAYQQGVVAGGKAYTDTNGDAWAADRAYSKGAWGYVQKSKTASTTKRIGGTTEPALFKTQRINPYAYRFDNVPNGIYQVELNFAELANVKMGKRLFDVIIENTQVLPAHDIVYEVGTLTADQHTFFVEVADGQMDVRLIPRAGFELPVINSLRVTHRPDR